MWSFMQLVHWVLSYVLQPIHQHVLLPVYHHVLIPIYEWILILIAIINGVLGWVSGLYNFRITLMIQGLVFYWRGCIYFQRSTLWITLLEEDSLEAAKSYLVPQLWRVYGVCLIVIVVIVFVTAFCGESNIQKVFNVQGTIGVHLYRVPKSIGEMTMMWLMIHLSNKALDPSVSEIHIASFFSCLYITLVSLLKLCYVGSDLGLVDGIASVTLSTFTHYCKTHETAWIFICAFLIWVKNIIFSECCAACSQAAAQGGGGGGGNGVGGGRGGGGNGGGGGRGGGGRGGGGRVGRGRGGSHARRRAGGSGSLDEVIVAGEEVFHSTRSSI